MPYQIIAISPGETEVLEKINFDIPKLSENDVLIKLNSIGVNFIDIYFRKGLYPWPVKKNLVLGSEASGFIEDIGSKVKNFKIGDRVAYAQPNGSYATHKIINEKALVKLPDFISFEQAASSMLKGLTVRYLIKNSFKINSKHAVLFHAAAGGVGLIAGQWIKSLGATCYGTAGSDEKCMIAKKYGYSEVFNYAKTNFLDEIHNLTNNQGLDVVYDSVGKDTMPSSFKCLKKHGTVVSFGQSSGAYTNLQMGDLATGSYYLTRPTLFHFYADAQWLKSASEELFSMINSKKILLDQMSEYSLENVFKAHLDIEDRKTTGSVILKP